MTADKKDIEEFLPWPEDGVDFVPNTQNLGNAEFIICTRYERGKLRRLFVSRRQQEDRPDRDWLVEFTYPKMGFDFSSLNDQRVWLFGWCEYHKCPYIRLYVPRDSNHLSINAWHDPVSIRFSKKDVQL